VPKKGYSIAVILVVAMNRLFSLNFSRSLIRCAGKNNEASQFLQGMITNDMRLLESDQKCIYTLFLNKLGRILYDSLIYKLPTPSAEDETFLIECDNSIASNLIRHLKLYRVRRKIDIALSDDHDLYCYDSHDDSIDTTQQQLSSGSLSFLDPRLKNIGARIITNKSHNVKDEIKGATEASSEQYISHRYKLGICEGIVDLPPEKTFPLESNCDFMNGVSFHKGCYLGQELTARTHHTGVVRKRLMPLVFETAVKMNESVDVSNEEKKSVGKLRGVSDVYGLALMRVDPALAAKELSYNENKCTIENPFWWPTQAVSSR
jgi:folate-binding protein YgfZ